ncbi:unnamed protein product [Polarella glacialis]|uniref:phosphatidyl-N-methylethanolamine N-methyltransferase n=1 Tax=Polarella glacialis TaxID=89957 RepID=A0A813EIE8_POLGL|nr:unnamed protein product [Polarella glacialis]CAE8614846.1 unnamed protein product [Polarella glacialis]
MESFMSFDSIMSFAEGALPLSSFTKAALPLLGIERFLYGYIYQFPESFKRTCKGPLKPLLDYDEGVYWQVAKHLGVGIKVFQFGVIGFDLLVRRPVSISRQPELLGPGLALMGVGQLLNTTTFNAIGAMGVYYGSQLGYHVPWASCFPYNIGIGDPQYWGVVLCVWGAYLSLAPTSNLQDEHFVVPWLTTFWYVTSMKLLENSDRGGWWLKMLGLKKEK